MPGGRPGVLFEFTIKDLADLVGMTPSVVRKHVERKHLNLNNLESIVCFIARYSNDDLKHLIVRFAIDREAPIKQHGDSPVTVRKGSRHEGQ